MPITQLCKFPSLTKTALLADYVERLQIIADKESQLCLLTDQGFCPQCVLDQVNRLFARWPDPTHRPSLFGVPIGVKDIFRVDGYVIRVGSLLPGRLFCAEEARLVTLLKNLGAVVLAITASTEFAHAAPSVARNPHNIHYTPGGSSSGSAAGVAAGFFPLALGTQTMGSIVRPAAFCGVCGWKAPIGAWSKVGIIPFAPSIDEPGLFAQSTEDIAYAVDCFPSVFPYPQKITLKKWRLGVVSGSYLGLADPDMRAMFSHLVNEFAARCPEIELEEIDLFPDWNKIENVHRDWAYKELSLVHENWFARFQPLYRAQTLEAIERGKSLGADAIRRGLAMRKALCSRLARLYEERELHGFLAPAALGEAPIGLAYTGNPVMNIPWSLAGCAVECIPIGLGPHGLPLGVQIVANWGFESQLPQLVCRLPGSVSLKDRQ